jgi:hypothetical protein
MMFASLEEVARAKEMALQAYVEWKTVQLLPHVRRWDAEGCCQAEIERRLDDLKGEVQAEAARTLRLVSVVALKDGAFSR